MKAVVTGVVMALAITAAGAAEPNYASANVLLPACKIILEKSTPTGFSGVTVQQIYDGAICAGMMSALLSVGWDRMLGDRFCVNVPPGATREQGIQIAVRYIEARPQRMHEPFVSLAVEALHDAWPCK